MEVKELLERLKEKDQRALAKLITLIEKDVNALLDYPEFFDKCETKSKIIGFTGSPGAGKSTLVDKYITELRKKNYTVGVIAVDPSSPFTGGAILGDRVRMRTHFLDDSVFIRSMGSHGNVGGLNEAIFNVILLYQIYGFDYIIIETVGAGQSEIDIAYVADTVVLVLSPGTGDDIQLMKAGIMEIGDVYVVNKADIDGAELLKANLQLILELSNQKKDIVMSVASSGMGITELTESVENHYRNVDKKERKIRRTKKHIETIIVNKIKKLLDSTGEDLITNEKNVLNISERVIEKLCAKQ